MSKLKISESDCKEISGRVFVSCTTIWVNCAPDSNRIEVIELLETDEYDFDDPDSGLSCRTDWEKEMYQEQRKLRAILKSWKKKYQLEKAPGYKGVEWMEEFVDEIIFPKDPAAARKMARAIGGKGTFYRFKEAAYNAGYLDEWYTFLNESQYYYVARQFHDADIEVTDKDAMPLVILSDH